MKNNTPEKELIIIQQVLNGQKDAFRYLVEEYKSFVFNLAFQLLKNKEEAEEVAQDSFIRAYKYLSSFNGKAKFSTWLYKIVYNTALTQLKRRKKFISSMDDVASSELPKTAAEQAANEIHKEDQKYYLEKAIARLSSEDQALITLFYMQELSLQEVSQVVNLPENTIKVRLHRIRKRLQKHLQILLPAETQEII
ncbi:RNA polymerase sigma factor [Sediminitomix flava]|uniref:RNA polymerase sigma factor n=1 Tax=Sediminitomix flava TaxID=379075 RepID=A0A315Z6J6_SEDFL|nr:sigma-70 family RNA polymerase sigma factor [Sediminitomix flava]PWJ39151.1 RNA polymerase ECF family sigma subunit [Sediminitomix flava]